MNDLYLPRPERLFRFRFGLKTFFALVAIAACAAWVQVQLKWIEDRHEARQHYPVGRRMHGPTNPKAPWNLRLFGESGTELIKVDASDAERERIQRLFPESTITRTATP